jgi:alpha-beta hydrolase superfamily lysophospholipase
MFRKNAKGLDLFTKIWDVPAPEAVIALIHGQGEHIMRYGHVAEFFNQNGIVLAGYDQQGFGQSGGKRGHAERIEDYLDDIGYFLAFLQEKYAGVPLFLYGHSMGGNVSLNYLLRRQPNFLKGAIISGPWVRLAFEPPKIKVLVGRWLRNVWPTLTLPTALDTRLLSKDPTVVQAYNTDPLNHDKVSAAAGIALMDAAAWLDQYTGPVPCPLLFMHAAEDGITSMPSSRDLAGRLGQRHIAWAGMYHEIHNEPGRAAVFEAALEMVKSYAVLH